MEELKGLTPEFVFDCFSMGRSDLEALQMFVAGNNTFVQANNEFKAKIPFKNGSTFRFFVNRLGLEDEVIEYK